MGRNSSRSGESEDADAGSAGDATAAGPSTSAPSHSASIREQFGLDDSSTFQHSQLSGGSDSPGPTVRGQAGRAQYEDYYGVEISSPGEVDRLQRLEEANGLRKVREWADEEMPIAAMSRIPQMEAFRESKGTPVPWDVEQRNEASRRRNTSAVQRAKRGSPAGRTDTPESVREVLFSPGRSLDASIQRAMEERMGDSLGDVRIHTGPKAAKACEDIDARAFTVGNHVAFNHGEYDPESPDGQHVLAHELAHVRQQTGGAVLMLPKEDVELEVDPDPALERDAEETAQRVMAGGELGIQCLEKTAVRIQRLGEYIGNFEGIDGPAREVFGIADELDHPAQESVEFGEVDEERFNPEKDKVYRDVFDDAYPELTEVVIEVHHAVEQNVLEDFPGVVSNAGMHSLENLRGIPRGDTFENDLHRSSIRKEWNKFYKEIKPVRERWIELYREHFGDPSSHDGIDVETLPDEMVELRDEIRERLLAKAAEIDETYGEAFLPEVPTDTQ